MKNICYCSEHAYFFSFLLTAEVWQAEDTAIWRQAIFRPDPLCSNSDFNPLFRL